MTIADEADALNDAAAGDVITIANGTYTGSFSISDSGTAEDPIVIRGESRDGVVLDGEDCACNVIEIYGSYTHVENLTIQKDGKGRLYYRVGMTYAPASLQVPPADYGFVV